MEIELTQDLYKHIIAYIKTGADPEIAAGIIGLTDKNFLEWMRLAEEGIQPYNELQTEIVAAKEEAFNKGYRSKP